MDARAALDFVGSRGVVLVAAKGPVPRLTEVIAGEPIVGSWWGHPKGHEIYAVLNEVMASSDVLVCRVVGDKVTLVHRRLWPSLVRAATHLGVERLARVEQEHTPAGHHVNREIPFPQWADEDTMSAGASMTLEDAVEQLGEWSRSPRPAAPRRRRGAASS